MSLHRLKTCIIHKMNKIHKITVLLLCIFAFSGTVEARSVNTKHLDDDLVESFPIPVLFGVDYEDVVPDFGDSRGGGTREHEGQDMRAPKGTPIVSPTEAVVLSTGKGPSAGLFVYTANPGGEVFRYMHLDEVADLDRGDKLEVGDYIGTVGDTGNAPPGVYHLHFEVRDGRKALDPYPRLDGEFSLKEKMSFLRDVFRKRRDDKKYAEFLTNTFPNEFGEAVTKGYSMPRVIESAIDDSDIGERAELLAKLEDIIASIPAILNLELRDGDSGGAVALLQTYLIFKSNGPARDRLAQAGATGYFGSITSSAVLEMQTRKKLPETGAFDSKTRQGIMLSK